MLARVFGVAFLAALAAASGRALSLPDKACDLKKVEDGWWCAKDSKILDAKDVDTEKKVHKGTDHALTSVKLCVKSETQCQGCPMKWAVDKTPPG